MTDTDDTDQNSKFKCNCHIKWSTYCSLRKNNKISPKVTARALLEINRFFARFKVAGQFSHAEIAGYSQKTTRGYSAAMRLMLTVSSAERLGKVTGGLPSSWVIDDKILSNEYRSIIFKTPIMKADALEFGGNRDKMQDFLNSKSDNIMIPAISIRHMMAHGSFTPHGSSAVTVRGAEALEQSARIILCQCCTIFNAWLARVRLP